MRWVSRLILVKKVSISLDPYSIDIDRIVGGREIGTETVLSSKLDKFGFLDAFKDSF